MSPYAAILKRKCWGALNRLPFVGFQASALLFLGACYVHTGKINEGIQTCERAIQLVGWIPNSLSLLGHVYTMAGRTGEAQKVIEELQGFAEKA